VISTIAGDNWAATTTTCTNCGAGANVRGWDATDSDGNHVNVGNTCGASGTAACGNLEYDPNPPTTATAACNYQPCSAKFRQQSRATGYGNQPGPAVYGNVGWQIGGHYTWATIKAWEAQDNGNQFKFGWPTVTNSVMFDDAGFQVRAAPAPSAATTDGYAVPWITSAIGEFAELASILHGTGTYGLGPSFVVGTNPGGSGSTRICFVPGIAWCLREFTPVIYRITGTDYISEDFAGCSDPNAGIGMRDFLTTKCNAGTPPVKGFYEFEDDAQFGLTLNKGFHFYHRWDNMRSETLALAYFLMGYNPNVAMGLWSGTNGQTDYAVYWNPIPGTLSVALQWDCNQRAHRINVAGYSGFTHVGGDDGSEAGYYVFRIGGPGGDIVRATGGGGVYTTTTPYGSAIVGNTPNIQPLCNGTGSYPVGTTVEFAQAFRQSDPASPTPPAFLRAWHYASFPALLTAIGVPDTVGGWQPPGLNKGDGDLAYINACQSTTPGVCATGCSTYPCAANKSSNLLGIVSSSSTGITNCYNRSVNVYGCNSVGRRSFTNAEVYFAGIHPNFYEADIDVPGVTIPLGTMLYPLLPDGTTGPGVTSINLRAGEGFIGMRSPIP
jgi:hypothetical protein